MRLAILTSTLYKMGGAQIFARSIALWLPRRHEDPFAGLAAGPP